MQPREVVNSHSHSDQQIIDAIGIPDNITVHNCQDLRIGPTYVHNNNITINPCVDGRGCVEADISSFSTESSSDKKVPYQIKLKFVIFGLSFLLAVLVITIVTLVMKHNPTSRPKPQLAQDGEDYPLDKNFVTRDMWGAASPSFPLPNLELPVGTVIFIHTVSDRTCNDFDACKNIVLAIQDLHMNLGNYVNFGDIGYNFVIGGDGHIFVGRGWDKMGRHTRGTNEVSIGVAFVGDFRTDDPSPAMLESARVLLEVGVQRGKLSENYQLFGHCQCRYHNFPLSPGVNIIKKIQSWPHYNSTDWFHCTGFVPSHV